MSPKIWNEQEVYSRETGFDMQISYDASNRTQYVGLAYPKALTSEAKWSIYRLTYDGTTGRVLTRRYASGSDSFTNIWNNRASLSYTD